MMRSKIFVDSSFWLAFFNEEDVLHKRAVSAFQNNKVSSASLFTSDYVVDETLTRLKRRLNPDIFFSFFKRFLNKLKNSKIKLFLTDQDEFDKTCWVFRKNPLPKTFSFTDASIVAAMKIHKIGYLLTFDQDFQKIRPKVKILP